MTWSTASSICLRALRFASILSLAVLIFSSYTAILACTSPPTRPASLCALLRNPKIPILVISINIAIDANKYVRINIGARDQLSLSHTVAISLLTSNTTPITIIGITAAANMLTSPATLYQIATADIVNPLNNARYAINLSANVIFIS